MNGALSAAVCFGDAQRKAISNGARKTPPPTPVSPDTKPTDAPMPSAPHRGAVRSGASSWARRKTSVIDANSRTSPVTVLYRFSSRTTKPPTRAVGKDASIGGLSFAQSTWLPRLNSQVEYDAATTFNSNAVGRISFDGNDANAISARKAVPPACPTVAYSRDIVANSSASIYGRIPRPSYQRQKPTAELITLINAMWWQTQRVDPAAVRRHSDVQNRLNPRRGTPWMPPQHHASRY